MTSAGDEKCPLIKKHCSLKENPISPFSPASQESALFVPQLSPRFCPGEVQVPRLPRGTSCFLSLLPPAFSVEPPLPTCP